MSEVTEEQVNSYRRARKQMKDISSQTEEDMIRMIETLENDLQHIRMENFKLEKALKAAQDNLAVHAANQNNTSSQFMLPSEFKNKWEQMIKESLPNAFLSLCEHPLLMVHTVQSSCLYIHRKVKTLVQQKTSGVAQVLGLEVDDGRLGQHLVKLFQDHHQTAFGFNSTQIEDYRTFISQEMNKCRDRYATDDREAMLTSINDWLECINEDDLREWMGQFWLLMVYVCLSDQNLSLGYEEVTFTFQEYKKNDYYCVDGFGREGSLSLIVLPYVHVQNKAFAYHGLKHSVLILAPELVRLQQVVESQSKGFIDIHQSVDLSSSNQPLVISSKPVKSKPLNIIDLEGKDEAQTGRSQMVDENNEFRIKPQRNLNKSVVQQMKDTLDVINKLENGQSFDGSRTLQMSDRFYMQRILRTQNSRIEENSSFLGKVNTSLAGKIVHQRSVHVEEVKQPPSSSRLSKKPNKENVILPVDKRNSLEKLMKSFCQSKQRPLKHIQQQQQQLQHQRAQSNENNQRVFKNLIENFSSDDEEVIQTLNRGKTQKRPPDAQLTAKIFLQKYQQKRDYKVPL